MAVGGVGATKQNPYENMSTEDRHEAFNEMMNETDRIYSEPGRDTPTTAEIKRQAAEAQKKAMGGDCYVPKTDSVFAKVAPTYTDEKKSSEEQKSSPELQNQLDTALKGQPITG